jgi:hypothetical protein
MIFATLGLSLPILLRGVINFARSVNETFDEFSIKNPNSFKN